MRLGDYYRGLPLNLRTPLPPDEVARRIGGAIDSPMNPFASGMVGYARFGRVQLRLRKSIFSYNAMPVLAGPVKAEGRGALLLLKYRGHLATRLAFPLAFLMVGLNLLFFVATGPSQGAASWQLAPILAALAVFMILPLAIHRFMIRNAEADMARLAAFLRETLDAKDVAAPEGWTGG